MCIVCLPVWLGGQSGEGATQTHSAAAQGCYRGAQEIPWGGTLSFTDYVVPI